MKLLTNGSGAYLTGDDIADAVLRYAVALASEQRVDLVDVPYIADEHGRVGSVRLIVGWRADISAVEHRAEGIELLDDAVVVEMRARMAALNPRGDTPLSVDVISYLAGADDY